MASNLSRYGGLVLKGYAMGAANVIPGVSGGTIAFITGIYEELIGAIKAFDLHAVQLLLKGRFAEFSAYVHLPFLLSVFAGVGGSVFTLAALLSYAFEHHEVLTMSFFFGLILASIWFVGRHVARWNTGSVAALLLGTGIAAGIALLNPAQENTGFLYLFVCGIVAICSMILPGLSGSFVLLVMGNYWLILAAAKDRDLALLLPVMLGAGFGLVAFSHLLDYVLKRFHDQTVGLLTGFVLGSLLIIWPWKHTLTEERLLPDGEIKVAETGYEWLMPTVGPELFAALGLIVLGGLLVWGIEQFGARKPAA